MPVTTIRLRVYGHPAPQGSKSIIRGRLVETSKKLPAWRQAVTDAATYNRSMRINQAALDGPLRVNLVLYMPRPRKHYRTGKHSTDLRADAPIWCTTTPDADKCTRAVLDALTDAGIWHDDAQVAQLDVRQYYAPTPAFTGAVITITQLAERTTNA